MMGVESMLQLPELKASNYVAYNGAMIHMLIDQLEMRIRWAAQMSEKFSAAAGTTPQAALVEDLLGSAGERLRGILAEED